MDLIEKFLIKQIFGQKINQKKINKFT